MLFLLTVLTAGYFALVLWVLRGKRRARAEQAAARQETAGQPAAELPEDDQPPSSAVGWPPAGRQFTSYVDEGFAALDAYLSEGFAA